MIEVNAVSKDFGGRKILRDLSFTVPDGRITALLGANGAGKTTCLRIIGGLLRADSGDVRLGGIDVGRDPMAARRQLGVVGDREGLYERLTVAEYLSLFATIQGLSGGVRDKALQAVREELELDDLWHRRTRGFSQGERMKVSLARAMVHQPQHLILDEPTRGLDVLAARLLRKTLLQLRDRGTTILFSSHVMSEVSELSDQVLVMSAGRIVGGGTPAELLAQTGCGNLEDTFVTLAYGTAGGQKEGAPAC
ncbi:ABC transporter ATP-binding protein [Microbulbifer thermotolerans]|uniref:ABC transporter n=1 Tax=Microbulbifer thermotolerans TaxID=252514 RepID=A0A143HIM5_MICTH|nr:ABC transporter ATP-binding protein [Microbulbifer thermotolerans]AMX01565.1 ABC transporter [Microbulbifer thermotolerans]MCX2780167.1 ABC transporter ATP-binding protein [Microbulbifer thermotolerans]MCX2784581.1 ABC transporter ATP-binding protein [Microbulbifer thermotolerans]MCX2796449.1 ABC transporter ATP-binding protein [Microbulbifer thermotolerans]MCX2803298.1 ABC transporter ATP-binding protein [Microbulbifer thermotolerans]